MPMPDAEVAIRAELHTLSIQIARQKATITRTEIALYRNEQRKVSLEVNVGSNPAGATISEEEI